jgi:hypothetical protein
MLAQMLTAGDTELVGLWERLGTVGILVVAAIFVVRYLVNELAKKDSRLDDTVTKFIAMTKEFGDLTRESHQVQHETAEALKELRTTFTAMERRERQQWNGSERRSRAT